jgi:hypothetical protein
VCPVSICSGIGGSPTASGEAYGVVRRGCPGPLGSICQRTAILAGGASALAARGPAFKGRSPVGGSTPFRDPRAAHKHRTCIQVIGGGDNLLKRLKETADLGCRSRLRIGRCYSFATRAPARHSLGPRMVAPAGDASVVEMVQAGEPPATPKPIGRVVVRWEPTPTRLGLREPEFAADVQGGPGATI